MSSSKDKMKSKYAKKSRHAVQRRKGFDIKSDNLSRLLVPLQVEETGHWLFSFVSNLCSSVQQ